MTEDRTHPSVERRALVIDDDDLTRETICSMLEVAGFEVLRARDGNIGLKLFRDSPTDLVVTDILMPNKEGIETILELRRLNREVKIIAVSGGGRVGADQFLEAARKLGADDVLSKPFSRASLLTKINRLLS
jgi:DNA-binding response OmpR family regulator